MLLVLLLPLSTTSRHCMVSVEFTFLFLGASRNRTAYQRIMYFHWGFLCILKIARRVWWSWKRPQNGQLEIFFSQLVQMTRPIRVNSFDAEFGRQEMDGCLPMLDSLLLVVAMPRWASSHWIWYWAVKIMMQPFLLPDQLVIFNGYEWILMVWLIMHNLWDILFRLLFAHPLTEPGAFVFLTKFSKSYRRDMGT